MSIQALENLQHKIGITPGSESRPNIPDGELSITTAQRQDVISWLIIKGVDKSALNKSSLVTLGKMYRITKYLNSVLLTQERDQKRKPYKNLVASFGDDILTTPKSYTAADWDKTLSIPVKSIDKTKSSTPVNSISFDEFQNKILTTIYDKFKQQEKDLENDLDQNLKLSISSAKETAEKITKDKISAEIITQGAELKKFIEDTIFHSYLNHKIQNPTPVADGGEIYLYEIECVTNGHIYVGITENPVHRFEQHQLGNGAKFTQMHGAMSYKIVSTHKNRLMASIEEKNYIKKLKKELPTKVIGGGTAAVDTTLVPFLSKKEDSSDTIDPSLIPTLDPNYHFDPYATKVIRSALSMCENLYVYGDTGCGKTTHLEQVCAVLNRGLVRINPHDGITREMFLGGMKLINNETIFIEGALPKAMREGLVLLVDEISFLPPNLTAILNPIGEKGGKLYIPETSEWITPAPGFCLFATDNTGGKGDRTGNYTGTEVQNTATLDRFAFCLKMDYLPIGKEMEMLIKRFPNQEENEIEKMLFLARDIRLAFSRGELSLTLSTRKLIKFFDQRENNFTTKEALSNTILSWLDEDDETLVKTMIDRLDLLSLTPSPTPTPITTTTSGYTNIKMFVECLKNKDRKKAITIYQHVFSCNKEKAIIKVEEISNNTHQNVDYNPLWDEPCPWRPV